VKGPSTPAHGQPIIYVIETFRVKSMKDRHAIWISERRCLISIIFRKLAAKKL